MKPRLKAINNRKYTEHRKYFSVSSLFSVVLINAPHCFAVGNRRLVAFRNFAFTEADIINAIATKIYEGEIEGYNKYALVGFDAKGRPIEVFYNILEDMTIRVFHAMKARDGIIEQLNQ